MSEEKTIKRKSPFKDVIELEKEITSFINRHKANVMNHSKRISDYFEICCFNYVVSFYEQKKYTVTIENLISGKYKYKCGPSGIPSNFSHFKVCKIVGKKEYRFEIHHNLTIESAHTEGIYTTPDITVIKENKVAEDDEFYTTNRRYCFVRNKDMVTFCEAKQFNPFPELLFNFIGTINELKVDSIQNRKSKYKTDHLAPSLMISGKGNKHAEKIRESLESRYNVNLLFDLFEKGTHLFNRHKATRLKKIK